MPRAPGQPNHAPTRRRDVYATHARPVRRLRYGSVALARGTDAAGRFIGEGDVERGFQHFMVKRQRATAA